MKCPLDIRSKYQFSILIFAMFDQLLDFSRYLLVSIYSFSSPIDIQAPRMAWPIFRTKTSWRKSPWLHRRAITSIRGHYRFTSRLKSWSQSKWTELRRNTQNYFGQIKCLRYSNVCPSIHSTLKSFVFESRLQDEAKNQ